MDLKLQLLKEHSKSNSLLIRDYLIEHPEKVDEFVNIFMGSVYRLSQRAAMVISALFDEKPELLLPPVKSFVDALQQDGLHVAVKRNVVRILQEVQVEESLLSPLFDACIQFMNNPNEAIAVKAFSMKVLVNICKRYPDLKLEVQPIIEDEIERNEAKGIQARGKAMLKALSKI